MTTRTPKQEAWYQSCLAAFAQRHNRYNAVTALTWCAVCLGIPAEQVIEDARAAGVSEHDSDIRRGMVSAIAKVGSRPATGHKPRRREERQTFPGYVRGLIRDGGGAADFDALRDLSPMPVAGMSPQMQTAAFLAALYKPTDLLHVFASDRHRRGEIGRDILTRAEWLERMKRTGDLGGGCIGKNPLTGRQGTNGNGDPSYTSRDCIAAYRYALIEFDALPLREQCAFWRGWLSNPKRAAALAALTFSGGKSIHGLVRTGADAVTAPTVERDLRDLLCADPDKRYSADPNTLRPHGGTRLAGAMRHDNGAIQMLLYLARQ
ncbi:MAG: hypothetical protein IKF72_00515 [Kiritimatiellae bacterium]|nr:hypothetical protein [Kiritimatiellia bacterium]